jgi:hypothetical protein
LAIAYFRLPFAVCRLPFAVCRLTISSQFTEISDHKIGNPLNLNRGSLQPENNFTDRFEQYDDKINTYGFSLLHNNFFDQLILLPGKKCAIDKRRMRN